MKKLILLFTLIISVLNVKAQELAGRKIIQGSINFTLISTEQQLNSIGNFGLSYGKIKENNSYIAWGGALSIHTSKLENSAQNLDYSQFQLGPTVEFGKFVSLVDRFYLAPYIGGAVQGIFGTASGIQLNAYATPLRFLYNFSNHFMLSATVGSASMQFQRTDLQTSFSLTGSLTNHTGFGVFYTFK